MVDAAFVNRCVGLKREEIAPLNATSSIVYLVVIQDDKKVVSAYGRYSHSSGSKSVSWDQFLSGEMQGLVSSTMGGKVLSEVLKKLGDLTA